MQKLVYEGVLHMFLIEEISLAKDNCAGFRREPAGAGEITGHAGHVGRRAVDPSELEMFKHKLYRWAYVTRERMGKKCSEKRDDDVL
jgi:hypothetical protein